MDLHPDILSACTVLIYNFLVDYLLGVFCFSQRKQIFQITYDQVTYHGLGLPGARKHDRDGSCLNIVMNRALSVLEQFPQTCKMQGIQQAKLSVYANFQVHISEVLFPLHRHSWVISDLCITPNSSPDSFPQRWVTVLPWDVSWLHPRVRCWGWFGLGI